MRKYLALFLILCVIPIAGCTPTRVSVTTNEVPKSLLTCKEEPPEPNLDTGDYARDFKNAAADNLLMRAAGADCRNKLKRVKELLN